MVDNSSPSLVCWKTCTTDQTFVDLDDNSIITVDTGWLIVAGVWESIAKDPLSLRMAFAWFHEKWYRMGGQTLIIVASRDRPDN